MSNAVPSQKYQQLVPESTKLLKPDSSSVDPPSGLKLCLICMSTHEPGFIRCPALHLFGKVVATKQNEKIEALNIRLIAQQKLIESLQHSVAACQEFISENILQQNDNKRKPSAEEEKDDESIESEISVSKRQRYNNSIISLDTVTGSILNDEVDNDAEESSEIVIQEIKHCVPPCEVLSEWLKINGLNLINKSLESLYTLAKGQHWNLKDEVVVLENTMLGQAFERTDFAININTGNNERCIVLREPVLKKTDMQQWFDRLYPAWFKKNYPSGVEQVSTRDMIQDMQVDLRMYAAQSITYSEQHPIFIEFLMQNGFEMKLDQEKQPIAGKNINLPEPSALSILSSASLLCSEPSSKWFDTASNVQLYSNHLINDTSNSVITELRKRIEDIVNTYFLDSHTQMIQEFKHFNSNITPANYYSFIGYNHFYTELFVALDLPTYHLMLKTMDTIEDHIRSDSFPILDHIIETENDETESNPECNNEESDIELIDIESNDNESNDNESNISIWSE
jgi:hypothetical protein